MKLDFVIVSARANLLNQIAQMYFGWLWWVVEPVLTMLIYYFVFEFLLSRGGPDYVYILLVGVVVWTWFGNTVSVSSTSILREKGTISCININKSVFPAIAIMEHVFRQIIVLAILLLFLLIMKGTVAGWFYLPVIVLEQFLLVAAVSFFVAGLVPFFPDMNFLITISLRAAMFCSGVFFTVDMLPENARGYFMLNPMANIIDQYRNVLLDGAPPHWHSVALISISSLILLMTSLYFIRMNNQKYPRLVIQ